VSGWRRNDRKVMHVNQRDLFVKFMQAQTLPKSWHEQESERP
jgi:hypothetical protein